MSWATIWAVLGGHRPHPVPPDTAHNHCPCQLCHGQRSERCLGVTRFTLCPPDTAHNHYPRQLRSGQGSACRCGVTRLTPCPSTRSTITARDSFVMGRDLSGAWGSHASSYAPRHNPRSVTVTTLSWAAIWGVLGCRPPHPMPLNTAHNHCLWQLSRGRWYKGCLVVTRLTS